MIIVHDPRDLAALRGCVFVPTMGALHAGHAALIAKARQIADAASGADRPPVVASVFVNPTQFNDPADLERYPRTPGPDAELARQAGADAVFCPSPDAVYPTGRPRTPRFVPRVANTPRLEDAFRPGHFEGVCAVVERLFDLLDPSAAVFGEKDWQQLAVIRAMAAVTHPGVAIVGAETVRDPDGVAMSSRNTLLRPHDRLLARAVPLALSVGGGPGYEADPRGAEEAMEAVLRVAGLDPEYAAVRDAETLLEPIPGRSARSLIAARCGGVRLIDNQAWPSLAR